MCVATEAEFRYFSSFESYRVKSDRPILRRCYADLKSFHRLEISPRFECLCRVIFLLESSLERTAPKRLD